MMTTPELLRGRVPGPAFLAVPDLVYRRDPWYTRPFPGVVEASLARPEFVDRQQAFTANVAGAPVARVLARVSPTLKSADGSPLGMLGFFEALDQPAVVTPLLRAAAAWLGAQGCTTILGPLDGDTWHRYRCCVGPFDYPPFLMEPYNPPYYAALWRAAGFVVDESYYSLRVEDAAAVVPAMTRFLDRAEKNGFRFRHLRPERFADELARLYRLSTQIFVDNYLYTPISEAEFVQLYAGARSLVAPELVWFAQAPDGTDVGYLFAVPDYGAALRAMGGHRGPLAKLRFLWHRRQADTVNLKTLGVVPAYQRRALGPALMALGYREAVRRGLRHAHLCLIREGNSSGKMEAGEGELLRRYELYRCAGEAAP
jgi:GNAT superfamily N-acetyltransferase